MVPLSRPGAKHCHERLAESSFVLILATLEKEINYGSNGYLRKHKYHAFVQVFFDLCPYGQLNPRLLLMPYDGPLCNADRKKEGHTRRELAGL